MPKKAKGTGLLFGLHRATIIITVVIFSTYAIILSIANLLNPVLTGISNNYLDVYRNFLYPKFDKTTLILFENNAELRYGGGFIGSVGLLKAGPGGYKLQPIRSTYYYDHRIDDRPSLTPVPDEMTGFINRMHLRDTGIYLDWSKSAQLASQYFQAESGEKVDNVVMITPTLFKKLLTITGPIKLDEYNITVDQDNFLTDVQLEVEKGIDKQDKKDPKTILGVLGNQVIQRLLGKKLSELGEILPALNEMIEQKQLLLYSSDQNIQNRIDQLGASGKLSPFSGSSLLVGEANLGANKSSPFIRQQVDYRLKIRDDGSATVKLSIDRQHTSDYQYQYVDPADGVTRWLVGDNVDKVKLYLPMGSDITRSSLDQSQYQLKNEDGRLSVNYTAITRPLGENQVSFEYELPYRYILGTNLTINSLFAKQPGGFDQTIHYSLELPTSYQLLLSSAKTIAQTSVDQSQSYTYDFEQQKDQMVSLIFQKR